MKKILGMLSPSLIIFVFIFIDNMYPYSKGIILGIYLFFPVIFIGQGIICSNSIKDTIIGLLLSAIVIIITISIWYNMGSMLIPVIIYFFLGLIASYSVSQIKRKSN